MSVFTAAGAVPLASLLLLCRAVPCCRDQAAPGFGPWSQNSLTVLHGRRSESHTGACCPLLESYGYFFFQHSSWKTGKAIRAVGCSFLWPSLLEVTDYPQLATLEPVPRAPWASTLLSHMVSTCWCLLLGADPIRWVPTSLELESKKKKVHKQLVK